jgi:hypothetical protein
MVFVFSNVFSWFLVLSSVTAVGGVGLSGWGWGTW